MPLRLVEAVIPEQHKDSIKDILQDVPHVAAWTAPADSEAVLLNVLMEAQHTESLSDQLATRFSSWEGFRLVLLPVEATLPVPEEEPKGQTQEEKKEQDQPVAERISREELYEDVAQASRLTATYATMVALSTVVAAVGLLRNDVAVIIGAMVIAPLLGPNVALSLGVTLGDLELVRRSLRTIGAGVLLAAGVSLAMGLILPVDPSMPEFQSRTAASLGDLLLAFAAGTAGSLAFTSGVPAVLVGVMVAVALLPPLVVAGLLTGAGYWKEAVGALVLLLINVTSINLAAVATFWIQRVSPRTWWEADRARRSLRIAVGVWLLLLVVLIALILLTRPV